MITGKWLILGVFGIALISGVGAWVHRYYRTDEVQKIWGTKTLNLIAHAPLVEAAPPSVTKLSDISRVPGMSNIRYMLGSDFSYFTEGPEPRFTAPFRMLKFTSGGESVQFTFNSDCTAMYDEASNTEAHLVPAAAQNLRLFFDEQFAKQDSGEVLR
jgi:hypothetical protein